MAEVADIDMKLTLRGGLAVVVLVTLAVFGSALLYGGGLTRPAAPRPLEPSLEVDNEAEYRLLLARQSAWLNSSGPGHISIAEAKKIVLREGVR